jgi:hypothetical protein
MREHVAAGEVGHVDSREVDGGAAAGRDPRRGLPVHLQTPDPRAPAGGQDLHVISRLHRTPEDRARDDGAEAAQGENAVHGQAQKARGGARRRFPGKDEQGGPEFVQALAALRRDTNDRPSLQEGAADELADLQLGQGLALGVGHVATRQGH